MITKAFIWLSVLAMHACAAVVTLYGVSFTGPMPSDLPSVSFQEDFTVSYRAISPSQGSDVTTYEVQEVITQEILVKNYGTATSRA
ncbi:hypothetical protein BJ165DRAFT_1535219 [Panaeolus papilionaceus]|nr:hypothetical protein BJ165DRAFT_1535219 [Panaeolus papilionaceus]